MSPAKSPAVKAAWIAAASAILVAVIGYFATVHPTPEFVSYTGTVKDANTLKPVAHASVAITEDQKVPERFTTDSEGVFFAKLSKDTQTMVVEVEAPGYQNYSRQ